MREPLVAGLLLLLLQPAPPQAAQPQVSLFDMNIQVCKPGYASPELVRAGQGGTIPLFLPQFDHLRDLLLNEAATRGRE